MKRMRLRVKESKRGEKECCNRGKEDKGLIYSINAHLFSCMCHDAQNTSSLLSLVFLTCYSFWESLYTSTLYILMPCYPVIEDYGVY